MKSRTHSSRIMGEVTIIIPVKDEEVGLEFLLDDYRSSSLKDLHDVTFIFVIDKRTSDSSKKIASESPCKKISIFLYLSIQYSGDAVG